MNQDQCSIVSGTKLTREIVQLHIDYGDYVVAYDSTSKSLAYKYIMRVFVGRDGALVPNWFYCPFCTELMEQNVTIGTTPLLRHLDNNCSKVPQHVREELSASRNQKSKKSKTHTQTSQSLLPHSSLSQSSFSQPTLPLSKPMLPISLDSQTALANSQLNQVQALLVNDMPDSATIASPSPSEPSDNRTSASFSPLTLDEIADALVQANRIGTLFAETLDSDTYKKLLMSKKPWYDEAEEIAMRKKGVRQISIVLPSKIQLQQNGNNNENNDKTEPKTKNKRKREPNANAATGNVEYKKKLRRHE